MSKMRRILFGGDKGFTLIELLVVIAVLGILAAIAIPRLSGVTDRAKKSEATSALGSIKTALEIEQLEDEDGNYPADIGALAAEYLDGAVDNGDTTASYDNGSWTISWADAADTDNSYTSPTDGDFTVKMVNGEGLEVYLEHSSSSGYTIIGN